MLAGQLLGDLAAALVGDVLHVQAIGRVQEVGEQVVFGRLAGTGHDPLVAGGLGGLHVFIDGLDAGVLVDPQHEGVFGHARDRREGQRINLQLRLAKRRGVEAVQGDHDGMVGVLVVLHVHKGFRTGTAGLVDRRNGLRRQLMLFDDRLHQTRQLVGAPAFACHHDELNRLNRLPGQGSFARDGRETGNQADGNADAQQFLDKSLHGCPPSC